MSKNPLSRRNFLKSSSLASGALLGAAATSCSSDSGHQHAHVRYTLPSFNSEAYQSSDGVSGLLYSQVGYEQGLPVKVMLRLPKKDSVSDQVNCNLIPATGGKKYSTPFVYWGEVWGSHWWIALFDQINESGEWVVNASQGSEVLIEDSGLQVGKDILWDKSIEYSSVDMLERRKHFTGVGAGWQDAGTKWVESPAQSGMIISLEELLEYSSDQFDADFIKRIEEQITVGCDYLVMTQEKAEELGYPKGSFSHDIIGHEKDILPNDGIKAVVALMKAVRLLSDSYKDKKAAYEKAAKKAYSWLTTTATPLAEYGMSLFQRGLPEDTEVPKDEWPTRELVGLCWASLEMWKVTKDDSLKANCVKYANKIAGRQIGEENAEAGYYGHFYEFDSLRHSELAWVHGIILDPKGDQFGSDMGGFYPNYLVPVIEMLELWPDEENAASWKKMMSDFVSGYLKPVCAKNPFNLIPLSIYGDEGPVWFCGTFHGTNAVYGFTAALALELYKVLEDEELKEIAYGNLQWLAGLNGGITKNNVALGCVVYSTDVPEDAALPASMICGIGNRWAGTWFQTRGVICNGFSTGKQFEYDVEPKAGNDGPFSLTDEDWIPHSAGWVAGLIRLKEMQK